MKLRDSTARITRYRGDGRGVQGCHRQSGLLPRLRQPHSLLPLQAAGGLPPAGARHHVVSVTSYTRGLTQHVSRVPCQGEAVQLDAGQLEDLDHPADDQHQPGARAVQGPLRKPRGSRVELLPCCQQRLNYSFGMYT